MTGALKVLVADDQDLVREGFALILERAEPLLDRARIGAVFCAISLRHVLSRALRLTGVRRYLFSEFSYLIRARQ